MQHKIYSFPYKQDENSEKAMKNEQNLFYSIYSKLIANNHKILKNYIISKISRCSLAGKTPALRMINNQASRCA